MDLIDLETVQQLRHNGHMWHEIGEHFQVSFNKNNASLAIYKPIY